VGVWTIRPPLDRNLPTPIHDFLRRLAALCKQNHQAVTRPLGSESGAAHPCPIGCVPKIVLGVKIAQRRQPLPVTRRAPFAKAPIAQGYDRNQHNLWDTTCPINVGGGRAPRADGVWEWSRRRREHKSSFIGFVGRTGRPGWVSDCEIGDIGRRARVIGDIGRRARVRVGVTLAQNPRRGEARLLCAQPTRLAHDSAEAFRSAGPDWVY
jgi:hypothetical protein